MEPLCLPESSDGGPSSPSLQCPSLELLVCLFCSESFPLLQKDLLLKHLLTEHKLVIADVKLITDLPKYGCCCVSEQFQCGEASSLFQISLGALSYHALGFSNRYLLYWKGRFLEQPVTDFCSVIKTNSTGPVGEFSHCPDFTLWVDKERNHVFFF